MNPEADLACLDDVMALAHEPDSPQRRARLDELIAYADAEDCLHSGLMARMLRYLEPSSLSDLNFVVGGIAELESIWTAHEDELEPEFVPMLLMQASLMILVLLEAPRVPLDRVELVRQSFEATCRRLGFSLRAAYQYATIISHRQGNQEDALRWRVLAAAQPEGSGLLDSPRYEIEMFAELGDDDMAIAVFEREAQHVSPGLRALCQLQALLPALRSGRVELADKLYRATLRIDDEDSFDGLHVVEALAMIPTILADESRTERDAWLIAADLTVLLERLSSAGRGGERPDELGGPTVDEAAQHYRQEALTWAELSDRVNGSDLAVRRMQAMWKRHLTQGRVGA